VKPGGGARATAGVLRFVIAAILLSTAVGKLLDVRGFAGILRGYRALPEGFVLLLAAGVPMLEIALAGWLASGRLLRGAAAASALLHGAYAAWSASALLRGLELANCGCFGVFLARPLTWGTVAEDGVLVLLSLLLLRIARGARVSVIALFALVSAGAMPAGTEFEAGFVRHGVSVSIARTGSEVPGGRLEKRVPREGWKVKPI
jgi:hypothetical protein